MASALQAAACTVACRAHRQSAQALQRGARPVAVRKLQPALAPRRRLVAAAAAEGGGGAADGQAVPPAWELAQRISADSLAMFTTGEVATAELILKKGLAEIEQQHPGDPSLALLCTQLWNLQQEAGQYEDALEQAQKAYDLMLNYFGDDSADAAFHGIRLGISLVVSGGDMDKAQALLVYGGSCAQHNLQIFWERLQEMEAAGQDSGDLAISAKKLMVSLAECNYYGAIAIVRKALQDADELELAMQDLEEAWMGGMRQMAMALPPEHPLFDVALRELGRLVPDAAGRPALQQELEGVVQRLKELLYLLKNLPESMKSPLEAQQEGAEPLEQQQQPGGGGGEEFLP